MKRLRLALVILGAALLAAASVWGIARLGDADAPPEAAGAPEASPAEGKAGGAAAGAAAQAPLYIVKDETRYELVRGQEGALGVRLVVENMPDKYEVRLGEGQASIDDDQRIPGGGNKREVYATVNFAAQIERMKKHPDEQVRLPIEVTDVEDAVNTGSIAIYIDPRRLRLDGEGVPPAPGPAPATPPAAAGAEAARGNAKKRLATPARQQRVLPVRSAGGGPSAQQNPQSKPTPKPPCPWYKRAAGAC